MYNLQRLLKLEKSQTLEARKKLVDQAQKALYSLYRKIRNIVLLLDLQLTLFDTLVVSILYYL